MQVIGVHNPGTPESALIDMRLLSECNELVVTVGSSYGSISAGIGGIAPVQMLHGLHKNVQVQLPVNIMPSCGQATNTSSESRVPAKF